MEPTARLLRVGADVTSTMKTFSIPFDGDFGKKFSSDLNIKFQAFEQLLDAVEHTINSDRLLPKIHPFHWKVPGFSQYYYPRSVNDLVWAIDGMISHSPVIS